MGRTTTPKQPPMLAEHGQACYERWLGFFRASDAAVDRWLARPRIGDVRPSPVQAVFKPRDHFTVDGRPKRNLTLPQAMQQIKAYPYLRFYRCSVCSEYHVGHQVAA